MTTATSTPVSSTLSKKERKALRKQMMERKEQLLAKHGRGGGASSSAGSARPRRFADIKPKLPGDPAPKPKPAAADTLSWTAPPQPAPHRSLPASAPTSKTPRGTRRHAWLPASPSTASTPAPAPAPTPGPTLPQAILVPGGPLTRAAAAFEAGLRRAAQFYRDRPWQRADRDADTKPRRADAHRALALLIKPLRVLGYAAVAGAIVLGRESRGLGLSETSSLVVLGMGLGLAVVLLALAEIAGALRLILKHL
ncbi:MAG: hypothetical protein AAGG38_10985 [Planctomycetota bacterium]